MKQAIHKPTHKSTRTISIIATKQMLTDDLAKQTVVQPLILTTPSMINSNMHILFLSVWYQKENLCICMHKNHSIHNKNRIKTENKRRKSSP